MGMISALTRIFRKVPKGKMAKEGRKRGGKAEKEKDAEGIGMSELSLINRALPPELLEKIFSYLPHKDLNNVMLVCKTWNDIGEAPALWSWFKIRKSSQLELKRLQGCQEIVIQNDWNGIGKLFSWTELCRKILQHPGLKKIILYNSVTWERMSLSGSDRSEIDADLLTEVFANMEEIEIHKLGIGSSTLIQANGAAVINCVLDAILDRPSHVKRLLLKCDNIKTKDVNSVRLVTAINKIQVLKLCLGGIVEEQANLLFKKMMEEGTSITSLSLRGCYTLSQLQPKYFFGVFDKLKEFGADALYGIAEPEVVRTFCEKIAAGSNLKILRLAGFLDLSQVDRSTLSRMMTHLEELELHSTNTFSRDDLTTVVTAIGANESTNLKKLTISTSLRSVESCLVAKMATQVENLTLLFQVGEGLKKEQMRTIFEAIAACGPIKLKRLFLGFDSNLHELDAEVLARAVNNLESLEFNFRSHLTIHQAERILSVVTEAEKKVPGILSFLDGTADFYTSNPSDSDSASSWDPEDDYESDPDQDFNLYQEY